ncbi:ATP-binding protein [Oligoflexus sp.]|uniref:ATP-binding protein n=1 Tax=Oligoflexus sp. TaxID=1971216 RepID=UPI002D7886A7|nr:ATP-binding protein [Oligoflexus sp.]
MLITEVQKILGNPDSIASPIEAKTFSNIAAVLGNLGQLSEQEVINKKLDAICVSIRMRDLCADVYYNSGYDLIEKGDPVAANAAIPYFLKTLDFAEQLQDPDLFAASYYGLNEAYNGAKHFKAAIPYGKKAAIIFEELKMPKWAASALKGLAQSYRLDHQPELALKAAEKALKILPPEFKQDLLMIYKELSEVHKVLGQYEEAFKYLTMFVDLQKELLTEDASKKYMQLRNQTLSEQNQMQAEQIQLLGKFRIVSIVAGGLAFLVCGALFMVGRQASVIKGSRQKMKEVLDHIEEGILMLGEDLRLKSGYSPHLDKIFARKPDTLADTPFLDLLFPADLGHAGQGALARETLQACLGSDELSWEFNSAHLPIEVQHGESILALNWQPLFNAKGLITRVLVSVRDITSLRAIEKKAKEESARVRLMQKKLEEVLGGKIPRIRTLLAELRGEWSGLGESVLQPAHQPTALRRLHTWKGAARTLGLKILAGGIHEMESALIPSAGLPPSRIEESWKALSLSFEDYEQLVNAFQISHGGVEATASDLYAYANLYASDMKERLGSAGCPQQGLMVLDHVLSWKPEVLPVIHEMLLHAVANSMDHGFIRPAGRNERVRPALIQIEALPRGSEVELKVTDNGAGINWSVLRKKAAENGFVPGPEQTLTDVLFLDGVSTAESTSETSGRGVGLSAIKSICSELGGTIAMEDAEGGGTVLRLEFSAEELTTGSMRKAG